MVETVADELYALGPKEFVAARDIRAKQAKDAGDRDGAAAIKGLRRPTVAAWLANQLVRRHPDEIGPLLELGAALREATATLSGPELRQLSQQRNELVQALVRQARRVAADAGQPVADDAARGLEDTLHAALADESAGEQLMTGRLTEALRRTGFAPTDGSAPAPTGPAPTRAAKTSTSDRRRAERRARLERELADAEASARAATEARAAADEAAAQARSETEAARRRLSSLQDQVVHAQVGLDQALAEQSRLQAAAGTAHAAADRATALVRRLRDGISAVAPPE